MPDTPPPKSISPCTESGNSEQQLSATLALTNNSSQVQQQQPQQTSQTGRNSNQQQAQQGSLSQSSNVQTQSKTLSNSSTGSSGSSSASSSSSTSSSSISASTVAATAPSAVSATSATTPTASNPQQFCLRWNNYQTNLTSVFDQLLQNESFVDVTLACDGHSIKAHKMVLSACSPYFQGLFFDNPCQHPIIIMKDVKWPELKAAVEFMYKGEINVSQDQIGPLLRVAEMLKIRGLADVTGEQELNATSHRSSATAAAAASVVPRLAPSPPKKPHHHHHHHQQQQQQLQHHNQQHLHQHHHHHHQLHQQRLGGNNTSNSSLNSTNNNPTTNITNSAGGGGSNHSHQKEWDLTANLEIQMESRQRKRRWPSTENSDAGSPPPPPSLNTISGTTPEHHTDVAASPSPIPTIPTSAVTPSMLHPPSTPTPIPPPFPIPPPLEAMGLSSLVMNATHPDDMEIKPGIAEMIREEERAKLMENSHAWLGASTSASIAGKSDSYQYQLQSMWQKCWNTNQNLIHHLRFRERGPLKSWRPETMAEAIFSVLKDGLSLSQAARKYDIPYPTFVLYANRVHNMLGPSMDGGTDLRPKGRGRPQRILLGIWPDEHIKGVIKTVVFRDAKEFKDEQMHLSYGRHSPVYPFQDGQINFPGTPCSNGLGGQTPVSGTDSLSPEAAAAVAAVVGLRQQMQMAAAAQHHSDGSSVPIPKMGSPASSGHIGGNNSSGNNSSTVPLPRLPSPAIPGLTASQTHNLSSVAGLHIMQSMMAGGQVGQVTVTPTQNTSIAHNNPSVAHQNYTNALSHHNISSNTTTVNSSSLNISRLSSPGSVTAHDLPNINSPDDTQLHSPLEIPLEAGVNLAVGVSGMAYKSSRGYSPSRADHLFQEDIADFVSSQRSACPSRLNSFKEPNSGIKIEPMTECRGE